MGRRQYDVNNETAYRWFERRRRGDSFRKIALDEGVDRRLVARVVRGLNEANHLNEVAAALRDVRAGFLREHLGDLELTAWFLLQLIVPPSIVKRYCTYPPDIEAELQKMVEDKMPSHRLGRLSLAPLNSKQDEDTREKEAKIIVEDLKEHLPGLRKQVEQWQSAATQYGEKLEQLIKQAKGNNIKLPLFKAGLWECLGSMSKFLRNDNLPPIPKNLESATDVALWLFKNPATRELLKPFHDNLQALENEYAKLEGILNRFEVRKALLEKQCKHCPLA